MKYGTPLIDDQRTNLVDAYSGSDVHKKKNDKQERIKERFHGAFTGGFSAGYYNSVGSKEGWAPKSFKVTRGEKSTEGFDGPSVEDFMDEEDLVDFENQLDLRPKYEVVEPNSDKADVLYRTLNPPLDGIGYTILRKMGWKEGQGIGPTDSKVVTIGDKRKNVDMAPKEEESFSFQSNVKSRGLGYGDVSIKTNRTQTITTSETTKRSKKIQSNNKKRLPMNLSISADYEEDELDDGGELFTNNKPKPLPASTNVKFKKPVSAMKMIKPRATCNDGSAPLEGFELIEVPTYKPLRYPKIEVPQEFVDNMIKSLSLGTDYTTADSLKKLDPKERAKLLNEKQLPEKSIFSLISDEDKKRLGQLKEEKNEKSEFPVDIPRLSSDIADNVFQSDFHPYSSQRDKYERYMAYLKSQINNDVRLLLGNNKESSRPAWIQELREFQQVAQDFRKEKASFNGRFTYSTGKGSSSHDRQKDPQEIEAEKGNYGPATRSDGIFQPERLLCKRFHVPYPGIVSDGAGSMIGQEHATETSLSSGDTKDAIPAPVDPNKNEALEAPKAPADLFQLVFGDEDDNKYDDL